MNEIAKIFAFITLILSVLAQGTFFNIFIGTYAESWYLGIGIPSTILLFISWAITYCLTKNQEENVLWLYWFLYSFFQWLPHVTMISFAQATVKFDNDSFGGPNVTMISDAQATVKFDKDSFLGPNVFRGTLCGTPFIFIALIYSFYEEIPEERRSFLDKVIILTAIDLFDNVDMLDFLFNSEYHISELLCIFIVVLSCLICFTIVIILFELRRTKIHECPSDGKYNVIASVVGIVVNLAFMGIRIDGWVETRHDISVFLAKNVFFCIQDGIEVLRYVVYIRSK